MVTTTVPFMAGARRAAAVAFLSGPRNIAFAGTTVVGQW